LPKKQAEEVLRLYREKYFDLNVRHFHEKLGEDHQIELSYTWVKQTLQASGLVKRKSQRGLHRKRRERRPLPGRCAGFRRTRDCGIQVISRNVDRAEKVSKIGRKMARS
jgi:hypothetical protein